MLDAIEGHTFLTKPLRRNPLVVDLGANRGVFARRITDQYPVRLIGIEPVAELFHALPDIRGASFEQVAATWREGPILLYLDSMTDATVCSEMATDGSTVVNVPGTTLKSLLDRHGIASAGLVKMDIEGAELELLQRTDAKTLHRADQLAIEFHDFLDGDQARDVERCKDRMRDLGFDCLQFSRDNSDVLFVNRHTYRLSRPQRMWIDLHYKYPKGLSRIAGRWLRWLRARGAAVLRGDTTDTTPR